MNLEKFFIFAFLLALLMLSGCISSINPNKSDTDKSNCVVQQRPDPHSENYSTICVSLGKVEFVKIDDHPQICHGSSADGGHISAIVRNIDEKHDLGVRVVIVGSVEERGYTFEESFIYDHNETIPSCGTEKIKVNYPSTFKEVKEVLLLQLLQTPSGLGICAFHGDSVSKIEQCS